MKHLLMLACLLAQITTSQAENTNFSLQTTGVKQLVQFISDAPLEKIVGKASEMSGDLSLNLQNLSSGSSGSVTVKMASFDTGLSLRNQHMRENHLHTNEFPDAIFTIKSIVSAEPADISAGGAAHTLLRGELDLHGVKKQYEMLGQIAYDPATGRVTARYNWNILLQDHQIPRPAFLFMKLSETQEVTVELVFGK